MKKLLEVFHLMGLRYKLVVVSDAWAKPYSYEFTNLDTGKGFYFSKPTEALKELQGVV